MKQIHKKMLVWNGDEPPREAYVSHKAAGRFHGTELDGTINQWEYAKAI